MHAIPKMWVDPDEKAEVLRHIFDGKKHNWITTARISGKNKYFSAFQHYFTHIINELKDTSMELPLSILAANG